MPGSTFTPTPTPIIPPWVGNPVPALAGRGHSDAHAWPVIAWQTRWHNTGTRPLTARIEVPLPPGLRYLPGSLQCQAAAGVTTTRCEYDARQRMVSWEGRLPPGEPHFPKTQVRLLFQTRLLHPTAQHASLAFVIYREEKGSPPSLDAALRLDAWPPPGLTGLPPSYRKVPR